MVRDKWGKKNEGFVDKTNIIEDLFDLVADLPIT